jgi:hypothetical protein
MGDDSQEKDDNQNENQGIFQEPGNKETECDHDEDVDIRNIEYSIFLSPPFIGFSKHIFIGAQRVFHSGLYSIQKKKISIEAHPETTNDPILS